jgi:hypothetical protein
MVYTYGKKPNRLRTFVSQLGVVPLLAGVLLVVVPVIVLIVIGAAHFKGTQANPDLTRQTLEEKGYTGIKLLGSSWSECSRDFIGQAFEATNKGVIFSGYACCWEKANGCLLVFNRKD